MTDTATRSTRLTVRDGRMEHQILVPAGYEGPPTSVVDVVERANAALLHEGEWCRSQWYYNAHPEQDWEDAFCNDWKACADGLILAVTSGAQRAIGERKWQMSGDVLSGRYALMPLVEGARGVLVRSMRGDAALATGRGAPSASVTTINDHEIFGRSQAEAWFGRAVRLARNEAAMGLLSTAIRKLSGRHAEPGAALVAMDEARAMLERGQ